MSIELNEKMKIMKKTTILTGAALLCAGAANAEGFYVGGSFGAGDAAISADSPFSDSGDRLYIGKAIGGFRVNDYLAVEGNIVGASNDDYDDDFDGEADVSFGAISASLLGVIPIEDSFDLYAKVGGYIGESEVDDTIGFFGGNSEDESGFLWGAGAFINFGSNKQFSFRLDYEEFDTDELDDFWTFSVGFQYNFQ